MKYPIDREAEFGVLSGMMNNADCMYEGLATVDESFFTDDTLINLFKKIVELSNKGLTTAKMLDKHFDNPKDKALLRQIDGEYTDNEHFKRTLEDLKNTYLKRSLYFTINKALGRVETKESKADEIIELIEKEIGNLFFDDENENIIDPSERAVQGAQEFTELVDNPDLGKGLSFSAHTEKGNLVGFPGLDQTFNGAQGGDLIMVAAKTGEGKTAIAVNLSRNFSLVQPYIGYYQNTEMKVREMESRLLSPIARVPAKEIFFGRLEGTATERDMKIRRVLAAYEVFRSSGLYLSRIPHLPLHKSKGLARQFKNRYKQLDYMIVDYVGRMDLSDKERNMQQWDVMYEIVKQLKELAMELDIPIFILAQRNQSGEVEGAKKMMNECDGVLFFEPVNDDDREHIENTYLSPEKREAVNYKIVKKKVRRDDNPFPIYCNFDKKMQFINEIPVG